MKYAAPALLAALLAASLATPASAAPRASKDSRAVEEFPFRFKHSELQTADGRAALYQRIERRAGQLCRPAIATPASVIDDCRAGAVRSVVSAINDPALDRLHDAARPASASPRD